MRRIIDGLEALAARIKETPEDKEKKIRIASKREMVSYHQAIQKGQGKRKKIGLLSRQYFFEDGYHYLQNTDIKLVSDAIYYDNPLPSRYDILVYLYQNGRTSMGLIMRYFELAEDRRIDLRRRLGAMRSDGQLKEINSGTVRSKLTYELEDDLQFVITRLFYRMGRFRVDLGANGKAEIASFRWGLLPGDQVLVSVNQSNGLVRLVSVLKGAYDYLPVTFLETKDRRWVAAFYHHGEILQSLYLEDPIPDDIQSGDKGLIKVESFVGGGKARLISREANEEAPDLAAKKKPKSEQDNPVPPHIEGLVNEPWVRLKETALALCHRGINSQFGTDAMEGIRDLNEVAFASVQGKGYVDRRKIPFVTIDGADAQDFDDAVYCEQMAKGGFRLMVAIADVSYYVKNDSALDAEAADRGVSFYFPDGVVPMLPFELSHGLCSLKPHQERLAMVAVMEFDGLGRFRKANFEQSVIISKARLTYSQVEDQLKHWDSQQSDFILQAHTQDETQAKLVEKSLQAIRAFVNQRETVFGGLRFQFNRFDMTFSDHWDVQGIQSGSALESERLIEICMVAANIAAAGIISSIPLKEWDEPLQDKPPSARKGSFGVYRVHPFPDHDASIVASGAVAPFGINMKGVQDDYWSVLIDRLGQQPLRDYLNRQVLHTMKQALYSVRPMGHFGLGLRAYTHFTSPIRRYPDLLVHRILKGILGFEQNGGYSADMLEQVKKGALCAKLSWSSLQEHVADDVTESVRSQVRLAYLKTQLGESYDMMVTHFGPKGPWVESLENGIRGLLELKPSINVSVGDKVRVLLAKVDSERGFVNFEYQEHIAYSDLPKMNDRMKAPSKGRTRRPRNKPRTGEYKASEGNSKPKPRTRTRRASDDKPKPQARDRKASAAKPRAQSGNKKQDTNKE